MLTTDHPKIVRFLAAWHENGRARFTAQYPNLDWDSPECRHYARDRKKYIALDHDHGGYFLVDKISEGLWTIAGYGQKNKCIGTLTTLTEHFEESTRNGLTVGGGSSTTFHHLGKSPKHPTIGYCLGNRSGQQTPATAPIPPKHDTASCFMNYMMGWYCGAARSKAIDPDRMKHPVEEIREAYRLGFDNGRIAATNAAKEASNRYGYQPSVLRPALERADTAWEIDAKKSVVECRVNTNDTIISISDLPDNVDVLGYPSALEQETIDNTDGISPEAWRNDRSEQ
jgi:hypothetical protein